MDKKILTAYSKLVPKDQLVIDAMIISLYQKDKQINALVEEQMKLLSKEDLMVRCKSCDAIIGRKDWDSKEGLCEFCQNILG